MQFFIMTELHRAPIIGQMNPGTRHFAQYATVQLKQLPIQCIMPRCNPSMTSTYSQSTLDDVGIHFTGDLCSMGIGRWSWNAA